MRILYVHNYYQQRGGEDAVFEAESNLMAEHGHEVRKLIFENTEIKGVTGKIKAGLGSFYNISSARRVSEAVRDFNPDLIHAHNIFPLASPSVLLIAKKHAIPLVMTLHNYRLVCANALLFRNGSVCEACVGQAFPLNGVKNACYRDSILDSASITAMTSLHMSTGTWSSAERYIVLTSFAKRVFQRANIGLSDEHFSIKPNFVYELGTYPSLKPREEYFLFVGRLSKEKGLLNLLEAFQGQKYHLKIIGGGPLESTVKEAASRNSNIEYLGFHDREFVCEMMKAARALIFPSIWYEGFPMTIVEAFSVGTPVLATDIGGLPEIVSDGFNGFVMSETPSGILEAVEKIVKNGDLHEKLCQNARNTYLKSYTPQKNYELLLEIYTKTLKDFHAKKTHS